MRKNEQNQVYLLIIGVSLLLLSICCKKDNNIPITISDIDGNVYHTIAIGTQVWMKENLKTTKLNDNTTMPNVTDNTAWINLTNPRYCYYKNDAATYKATYGALYNWYTVNTYKLCPTGWHVPADAEWTTLINYLGGGIVAGDKLRESGTAHWINSNTGTNNETGFTALPGGYRDYDGSFVHIREYGRWWSSTEVSASDALCRGINSDSGNGAVRNNKTFGFSVRCVKD